jgi:hypothetical protein
MLFWNSVRVGSLSPVGAAAFWFFPDGGEQQHYINDLKF